MSGIVCAVRGGPDSQATIGRAIALAKETGQPLFLLYVVNLEFLEHTISSRVQTISKELHQMGEFILLAAQAAADAQGVAAQTTVRHGDVQHEIATLCHEVGADYLVIGWPRIEDEESLFTEAVLAKFTRRVEEQTGAKVILAGRGAP
jgi:nucleotide-binding universal stress UspA family protein